MELKEFFHMNEGDGELSYSKNSFYQKGVFMMSQPMLEGAIQSLITKDEKKGICKVLKVADLGCGVGQVPLGLALIVREIVEKRFKGLKLKEEEDVQVPEIKIYYNDLPSNDFNLLFRDLTKMSSSFEEPNTKNGVPLCFFMGVPGSYYGRLFPKNSLHLVHANYTLHWLSQAPSGLKSQEGEPINKGNIYITETSPATVAQAYLAQFQQDFTQFLKCRSQELVSDGLMLLTLRGRPPSSNVETLNSWDTKVFSDAFAWLISQGMIKEEKVDSFDLPFFGACEEEVQDIVEKEGSFTTVTLKTMEYPAGSEIKDNQKRADGIGKMIRAFSEPLFTNHFGHEAMDPLYHKITLLLYEHLAANQSAFSYSIIVLLKRN